MEPIHPKKLHPLEYSWLLLPFLFSFLAFPLARVVLSGICFVWVVALLFRRMRDIGYLRAMLMASVLMVAWVGICALLTYLANDLFTWAGEEFSEEGAMVTSVLMVSFLVYGLFAAMGIRLLGIGSGRDAGVLFVASLLLAGGAVLSGMSDSPWAFHAGIGAGAALVALHLRKKN